MQVVQAPRAAAILYGLLSSRPNRRPWLLPANICPIVPITLLKARVPFEFVDISPVTLHMDLQQATERLQAGRYGGVLYAHTYGEPSTPDEFFRLAKARDPELLIVDDRCLCVPDLDLPTALVADVALYSTGYAKHVDLGFGGYAFIRAGVEYSPASLAFVPSHYTELEASYKLSIRDRSAFIYRDSDWLETSGAPSGWLEYRARVAAELELSRRQRAQIFEIYAQALPPELQLPSAYQSWRFNLRVQNQPRVLEAIFSAKLFASAHYASLAGIMAPGLCPNAEILASEVLNLFIDRYFTPTQAEQLSTVVLAHAVV